MQGKDFGAEVEETIARVVASVRRNAQGLADVTGMDLADARAFVAADAKRIADGAVNLVAAMIAGDAALLASLTGVDPDEAVTAMHDATIHMMVTEDRPLAIRYFAALRISTGIDRLDIE